MIMGTEIIESKKLISEMNARNSWIGIKLGVPIVLHILRRRKSMVLYELVLVYVHMYLHGTYDKTHSFSFRSTLEY